MVGFLGSVSLCQKLSAQFRFLPDGRRAASERGAEVGFSREFGLMGRSPVVSHHRSLSTW